MEVARRQRAVFAPQPAPLTTPPPAPVSASGPLPASDPTEQCADGHAPRPPPPPSLHDRQRRLRWGLQMLHSPSPGQCSWLMTHIGTPRCPVLALVPL